MGFTLLGIVAAVLLYRLEGGVPLELIAGSHYRMFGRMALLPNGKWLLLEGSAFAIAFRRLSSSAVGCALADRPVSRLCTAWHAGCTFAGFLALYTERENCSAVWLAFCAEVLLAIIQGEFGRKVSRRRF